MGEIRFLWMPRKDCGVIGDWTPAVRVCVVVRSGSVDDDEKVGWMCRVSDAGQRSDGSFVSTSERECVCDRDQDR